MYTFKHLWFLLLLIIPLFYAWWSWKKQASLLPSLKVSSLKGLKTASSVWKARVKNYAFLLRVLTMSLLIVALARPQIRNEEEDINEEGIDIVLSIDVSGSMLSRDFEPNRLEAAKEKARQFVKARPHDRIALVIFSGESVTQCPLTSDHHFLDIQLDGIESGFLQDGTAIGMGLATAVNNLKDSQSKSKVIILLTDGVNNAGVIDPNTAIELATQNNIVVYTIGVGQKGLAPSPVQTPFGIQYQQMEVQIDEELLTRIADRSNGKYFRATTNQSLEKIYAEIDKMEKSKITTSRIMRETEVFQPWLIAGLICLLLEFLLHRYFLRSLP